MISARNVLSVRGLQKGGEEGDSTDTLSHSDSLRQKSTDLHRMA